MKVNYQDFIGIYSDVYPSGFCNHIIKLTDEAFRDGVGYSRLESEGMPGHFKNDLALNGNTIPGDFNNDSIQRIFRHGLQACFENYTSKFSILSGTKLNSTDMKIQKTGPGEGYHIWHFEQGGDSQSSQRCLVFMLYLNSLEPDNAGETEFLYQQKRIAPKENTMIIWPAAYTHTHRGNPVHNAYKYVITGWFHII